jgi:polyisoprenoid-binding protein YceI
MTTIRRLLFGTLLGAQFALTAQAAPETYVFDTQHTYPNFQVGHLGFSVRRGWFEKTTGRVVVDREKGTGEVQVEIDAASLNTGLAIRDDVIRSDKFGFLDVAKHPKILFKSNQFDFTGPQLNRVSGEVTIKGITRPVDLDVSFFRCGDHPVRKVPMCGGEASTVINKSDFGEFGGRILGEQIRIGIEFEAYRE